MAIHELKIWSEFFREVKLGLKKAEFRRDIDHRFNVGDVVHLIEIKRGDCGDETSMPCNKYEITGNVIKCFITNVVIVNDVYRELNSLRPQSDFAMFSFHITGMRIVYDE